jgi:hypothetical protein
MIRLFLNSLTLKSWDWITSLLLISLCWIAWVGILMISVPLVFMGSFCVLLAFPWRFACSSGLYSYWMRVMAIPGTSRFVALHIESISLELSAFRLLSTGVVRRTPGISSR